jgi:hypothetical protein
MAGEPFCGESWREAFPEVPTNEFDAPGLWSDPNFSLSKSASIGKFWRKERERKIKKLVCSFRRRGHGKKAPAGTRKRAEGGCTVR